MDVSRYLILALATIFLLAGCTFGTPVAKLPDTGDVVDSLPISSGKPGNGAKDDAAKNGEPGSILGQGTSSASGILTDSDGRPVAGVKVRAFAKSGIQAAGGSAEAVTGSDGSFSFSGLPEGVLSFEAIKSDDLKAFKSQIAVKKNQAVDVGNLVLEPTGTISGRVTAPRNPEVTDFLNVDVFIPGSAYTAKTDQGGAYKLDHVAVGTYELAAARSGLGTAFARDVVVRPKETTTAPDLALSAATPRILRLIPPNGGPGTKVRIEGEHFGTSSGQTRVINFSGAPSTEVTPVDDGKLDATVPAAALTGDLSVTVDGLIGNGLLFTVLKTLSLAAKPVELLLSKTYQYQVRSTDTGGKTVPDPVVTWKVVSGTTVTLDSSGLATPAGVGDATVHVSSGNLSDQATIHVFRIDRVTLSSTSIELNALPDSGEDPEAGYVTSATVTATVEASDGNSRKVAWGTSDPALVAVDQGVVRTTRSLATGSAIVTAASVDDGGVLATVSVNVTTYGQFNLGIE